MSHQSLEGRASGRHVRLGSVLSAFLFALLAIAVGPSELFAQVSFNEAEAFHTLLQWGGGYIRAGRWALIFIVLGIAFWQAIGLLQGKKNGPKIGVLIGCIVAAFVLTAPQTSMRIVGLGNYSCLAEVALKKNVSQPDVQGCFDEIDRLQENRRFF